VRERAAEVLELRSALFENGREDVRAARKLLVVLSVASLMDCFKRLVDLFSLVTICAKQMDDLPFRWTRKAYPGRDDPSHEARMWIQDRPRSFVRREVW